MNIPNEWVEKAAQALGNLDVAPLFPAHRRHLARTVLAAVLPDVLAERDALADRIADEIKTAGLATAAAADIDDANRAWWYGYGYAIEDAARIAREEVQAGLERILPDITAQVRKEFAREVLSMGDEEMFHALSREADYGDSAGMG